MEHRKHDGRWRDIRRSRDEILQARREMERPTGPAGRALVWVGRVLSNPWFFVALVAVHLGWIVINAGLVPGVAPWDRPPFVLLATLASVEAPFIALLILMAQTRARRVDEIREEVTLQVDLYMERQTSAVLDMLETIQGELGIEPAEDADLESLKEPIDTRALMERIRDSREQGGGGAGE